MCIGEVEEVWRWNGFGIKVSKDKGSDDSGAGRAWGGAGGAVLYLRRVRCVDFGITCMGLEAVKWHRGVGWRG